MDLTPEGRPRDWDEQIQYDDGGEAKPAKAA